MQTCIALLQYSIFYKWEIMPDKHVQYVDLNIKQVEKEHQLTILGLLKLMPTQTEL